MKRTFLRMDYDYDESVFFAVEQYGEIQRYEVTGVSYLTYTNEEPVVQLLGYELTKTGKRRKSDVRPTWIYVPKQIYMSDGIDKSFVDTPRVFLENKALQYWKSDIGG